MVAAKCSSCRPSIAKKSRKDCGTDQQPTLDWTGSIFGIHFLRIAITYSLPHNWLAQCAQAATEDSQLKLECLMSRNFVLSFLVGSLLAVSTARGAEDSAAGQTVYLTVREPEVAGPAGGIP